MSFLVSPFTSFGSGGGNVVLGEPWDEIGRQESISGGALTLSGLDLTGLVAVRLIVSGITVTTDDTQLSLRFFIGGSEVSGASDYHWGIRQMGGTSTTVRDTADSEIALTPDGANLGVGNAATKSWSGVVTVWNPTSTLHKLAHIKGVWVDPPGNYRSTTHAGGALQNSGAITGFKVFGSSNLTGGSILLLGVA